MSYNVLCGTTCAFVVVYQTSYISSREHANTVNVDTGDSRLPKLACFKWISHRSVSGMPNCHQPFGLAEFAQSSIRSVVVGSACGLATRDGVTVSVVSRYGRDTRVRTTLPWYC
ncbi:uncharacterized protein LOC118645278 [Monomorium pharaonis]|uniref:uncharacterized protein LOC118645278 n=1 Tax=Monomorium pharaonis TaxID=307658 RepID=UPI001746E58F|nr:uncharacterized protein LOC118645278 [Monomorium pharaonis]